ncbi:hypothetical protein M9H77_08030 [Catharanthus roseus]|uniref:Uncharacterized protein n=1 Tax=Catharanthus roseus TaxID=4058 RepID=A0ACC0BWN1_CATRO|nr:hypothetical protein M9H77_08030 [Catharanthus roseus]
MNAKTYLIITRYQRSRTLNVDRRHNHKIAIYSHGHAQAARLTEEQLQQTEQFRKSHVPTRNILRFFRELDVGCVVSLKKIMDELKKARQMIEEPGTLSTPPPPPPPETAVTKGRRKTNSTKRDKKIGKSSGSGSGSNPSPRGRGRPPRTDRGRGRGRSNGRSSLSSVVNLDSLSVPFPFNNAFPWFMYEFIQNWKNVVGDGNCGFKVVSNFLFGDENHWVEIRRKMSYDLRHCMNVYEQLFSSVERVTELIMKTNWEEGSAPPEYWMDIPDHLYVIANTFNLCVVFLARSESTTVLPLVSNIYGTAGTIFIGPIEELQHFIQLQLVDECSLPPLQVQRDYHRDIRVSGWAAPYRNRMADWVTRYRKMYPPQRHFM